LSQAGWNVFAAVRSLELAPELGALAVEMDITDQNSLARACETIAVRVGVGGLQGLVNNAGLSVDGPVEIVPVEALRRQFEVNVIGQVGVTQAFLPLLRQGGGRVINIGGAAGRVSLPMYGALSASKAALDSISEARRMERKHQGVHVSYIEPGALDTRFFDTALEARRRDGHASEAAIQQIYAGAIEAAAATLNTSAKSPAESAARAIERALTARWPAARYRVGRDARFILPIVRRLPVWVRDRLVMANLGLGHATFRTS